MLNNPIGGVDQTEQVNEARQRFLDPDIGNVRARLETIIDPLPPLLADASLKRRLTIRGDKLLDLLATNAFILSSQTGDLLSKQVKIDDIAIMKDIYKTLFLRQPRSAHNWVRKTCIYCRSAGT